MTQDYLKELEQMAYDPQPWLANRAGFALSVETKLENFVLRARDASEWLRSTIQEPEITEEALDHTRKDQYIALVTARVAELDALALEQDPL